MAMNEKDLRAKLRAALGDDKADPIIEARETAEETAAKAKENGNLHELLKAMFAGSSVAKSLTSDGQLIENAPGTLRSPAMGKAGSLVGMTVRALAATAKVSDDEKQEAAADYIATKFKDHPFAADAAGSLKGEGIKSLNASSQGSGGLFVQDQTLQSVIELLRPQITIESLGPRETPLPGGSLIMPAHATGSTGVWLGEEEEISTTEPTFGERNMKEKTYAAMVAVSRKLLASASMQVETFVTDDLRLDAGVAIDLAQLRGNSAARPKGVRHLGIATATTGASLDQSDADMVGCLERMGDAGLTMTRLGWIMSWRTWRYLFNLKFAVNDTYVHRAELLSGTLLGFPYRRSSNVPKNLGGGTESELYCLDMDQVVVGRGEAVAFEMSTEAGATIGGNQVNAFQKNLMLIRMMVGTDIQVRHPKAVQIVTGITWGA
jgi:HK97 family phage major capsid protein